MFDEPVIGSSFECNIMSSLMISLVEAQPLAQSAQPAGRRSTARAPSAIFPPALAGRVFVGLVPPPVPMRFTGSVASPMNMQPPDL
jgi:hypothetical protein